MTTGAQDRLAAEARARVLIDAQLEAAGWVVQDRKQLNLFAAQERAATDRAPVSVSLTTGDR